MTDFAVLEVLLHDRPVGTLCLSGEDQTQFTFKSDYIDCIHPPVLGLGYFDEFRDLIVKHRLYHWRVMPFFSNLLPEGWLRDYLTSELDDYPDHEFYLLQQFGSDLPGAIAIKPIFDQYRATANKTCESKSNNCDALRFSLAGAQPKFSAIFDSRGDFSIPAKGIGGNWIIKLPFWAFEGVPENEYSMLTLARLIGMDVPAIKLVQVDEIGNWPVNIGQFTGNALAAARFDRRNDGSAVHTEDFAQIFGVYPDAKYKYGSSVTIAKVISREGNNDDISEFVKRLTFNALIGNADMHLKNWSLIYPNKRNAMLAPAYDFVSTICYIPDDKMALNVSRTKLFSRFSENELLHLSAKARLPEKIVIDAARETVDLFYQHWQAEKENLPLTRHMIQTIDEHIKTIPIAQTH